MNVASGQKVAGCFVASDTVSHFGNKELTMVELRP
jgi:hypothetical protein